MMKIGVIADTHIPQHAKEIPKAVLEGFKGADLIIHAGDLLELSVLDELRAICKDVRAVWGNMDPYEVKRKLPEKEFIKTENHKIGIMHGWGHPNKLIDIMSRSFKDDGVDLIIFGHSHCATEEKRGDILYFNPGSPTDKIFCDYNSYGIIEINDKIVTRIIRL